MYQYMSVYNVFKAIYILLKNVLHFYKLKYFVSSLSKHKLKFYIASYIFSIQYIKSIYCIINMLIIQQN